MSKTRSETKSTSNELFTEFFGEWLMQEDVEARDEFLTVQEFERTRDVEFLATMYEVVQKLTIQSR